MAKKSSKKFGILLCALILAVIVGCQSVGGLNLNDMILKQIDVSQQEQSQLFELEIEFNEELISREEPEIASMVKEFSKISLNIAHAKMDEQGNQWINGVFGFGKGDIPFTLHSDSKTVRFDIDGSKRPLIIELPDTDPALEQSQQAMAETIRQLAQKVAAYFVRGLPNPPVLSVDRVSSSVHGVLTNLTKVHAELNGEQLGDLIPVYLENLMNDKEGLRTTLREVFQWAQELPPEVLSVFGEGADAVLEEDADIDAVVEEAFAELIPVLEEAQAEIAKAREEEEWGEIFDKGVTMAADLYVDDSLHLRKSFVELIIAPAFFTAEDSPVRSIKIRSSGEMWNVNGDVVVPQVEVPGNALTVEEAEGLQGYQALRLFEPSSVLYNVLKNDFKIDDQSFVLSDEWGIPFYVDSDGTAYVPIRATMKEFGVKLQVPAAKGQIRFYDQATEQAVIFQTGSAKANVNGKSVTLEHKVVNDGHFVYVSADDLFGILHAEYSVSDNESGERIMEVARDL
ncbi:stalk domain-containing protein [Cohnella luojiensis]|uniref:Copper amine oxidase-like N-terminal domain-containing protein n=1 Tax=Cohnella luojiensis TaxID=652876 RepID=A0A4Y8LWQ0_9BACL|nr:stalk domain-containing protein [Cohnella luojiensis]TFE24255.1 hypothetical protein E2980_16590 [Cohnella luojiensis]